MFIPRDKWVIADIEPEFKVSEWDLKSKT